MKVRYLTQVLFAILLGSSAFAGSSQEHRMAASVDPLSWIQGNFNFEYEVSLCDQLAVNAAFSFGIPNSILKNDFVQGNYVAPQIGLKYYLMGKATEKGFYINPLLGLGIVTPTPATGAASKTAVAFAYSFYTGYAWNVYKGIWLDAFAGFAHKATSLNENAYGLGGALGGMLDAGMMVGYAW